MRTVPLVSLREKGVDLNIFNVSEKLRINVSLREKGVDLNHHTSQTEDIPQGLPS